MHPMERLRYVAGAGPLEHELLVQESAGSLAALAGDAAALLLSCKRLLQRHPSSGPLWWLCARMLCSDDPRREGRRCVRELTGDETPQHLEAELPEAGVVTVLGWPELGASVLARRGDLRVLVVDAGGEGDELASRLQLLDADAVPVSDRGVSAAVLASDVVVLEAGALGAGGFVAVAGSRAAAAVARHAGVPVWVVAGVGRVVPAGAWAALAGRLAGAEPWSADEELVPLELADVLLRPAGRLALPGHVVPDFSEAPELL
ncbi:MAG: hypothetical protein KY441_10860 [Actinobacteria bacterium]|nr:hypothetical protein [Actinomycetota bacterium]